MVDLTTYQAFLDSAPDAMVVIDDQGVIRMVNSHVEQLFGHTPGQLTGQRVEVLLPERLREYHVAHRRAFTANPKPRPMGTGMELWAQSNDGREFPVEISLSPVQTAEGRLIVAAVRDISARKEVEKALRDAKEKAETANETKSRFLAATGHDLRQPLQSLKMYLDALLHQPLPETELNLARKMEGAVRGLGDILDSLLDIARLDTGTIRPIVAEFAVHDLLSQVIDDVRPQAEAKRIELRLSGCRCSVRSDQGLLGRIVGNLVANAVRHTASGRILVGCRYRADRVRIEVRDSGPGIPEAMHEAIFEEYVQLSNPERVRSQGLGLGLSMVRRIAELLGHRVGLRSAPGRGSTFWVDVPLAGRDAQARPVAARDAQAAPATRRILYIEDDPDVQEATALILKIRGFDVQRASSGAEAYRAVSGADPQPDLILSDFRLPGTENGAQVVQRVRTLLERDVPVVFMTGDTSEARIRETRLTRCEVLRKPVDADKLSRAIEGVFGAPATDVEKAADPGKSPG